MHGSQKKKKSETKKMMKGEKLPFTLIESEILPRIPAKSDIGRCRCVCKDWRSFLSTPTFIRMHLHHHVTIDDYKLLLFDSQFRTLSLNETIPSNPNPNPNPNRNRNPNPFNPHANPFNRNANVSILASLDGLVCLASRTRLVLWNPLTGAYKKLSSITGSRFGSPWGIDSDTVGFYIDSCSNDYRLLCLISGHEVGSLCGALVYSHRLDSWREIDCSSVSSELYTVWSAATLCGQCLYYVVKYLPESFGFYVIESGSYSSIICFDVKTETFRKIQVPPIPREASGYDGLSLVVLDGCLHLCVTYKIYYEEDYYDGFGDLWRLEGDGDEWVKVDAFDSGWRRQQRICTASTGNWLAVLDQDATSFKKMNTEDFKAHYHYFTSATWKYRSDRIIYVQTLVSPNH